MSGKEQAQPHGEMLQMLTLAWKNQRFLFFATFFFLRATFFLAFFFVFFLEVLPAAFFFGFGQSLRYA